LGLLHKFGLNSLVDHYKDERHVLLVSGEPFLDLFNLILLNGGNLLVANSVSEDNHSLREALGFGLESLQRLTDDLLQLSDSTIFSEFNRLRPVLSAFTSHGSTVGELRRMVTFLEDIVANDHARLIHVGHRINRPGLSTNLGVYLDEDLVADRT